MKFPLKTLKFLLSACTLAIIHNDVVPARYAPDFRRTIKADVCTHKADLATAPEIYPLPLLFWSLDFFLPPSSFPSSHHLPLCFPPSPVLSQLLVVILPPPFPATCFPFPLKIVMQSDDSKKIFVLYITIVATY